MTTRKDTLIKSPIEIYSINEQLCYILYRKDELLKQTLEMVVKRQRELFCMKFAKVIPSSIDIFTSFYIPDLKILNTLYSVNVLEAEKQVQLFSKEFSTTTSNYSKNLKLLSNVERREPLMELGCGHKLNYSTLKTLCTKKKEAVDKGPFVLTCPLCEKRDRFYFLSLSTIAKLYMNNPGPFKLLYRDTDEIVDQCMICGTSGKRVQHIHSNHSICKRCLQIYLAQTEPKQSNEAKIKCPICEFKFVYTCNLNAEEKKVEYLLHIPFAYEKISESKTSWKKPLICEKCTELSLNIDILMNKGCGHQVCNNCLMQSLKGKFSIPDCVCPIVNCNKEIDCITKEKLEALIISNAGAPT